MKKTHKIWLNGKLIDWSKAKVHILTHTLHYGGGVFEGIRFYSTKKGPAIFRLKDHLDRLFYSAKCLGMKVLYSEKQIEEAILRLIRINKIKEGYIRPIFYYGYGVMGLNPKKTPVGCAVIIRSWANYLGDKPVKVGVSKFIRTHPQSTYPKAKICGHYVNSILASLEIKKKGFDEALLLDYQRNVAEGPGENIFMINKQKEILTPSSGSILPGITRKTIIRLARDLGYKVKEKKIKLKDLKQAQEAFFTGTAAEVTAIKKIDRKIISQGRIGPVTKDLKEMYLRVVHGEEVEYRNWLTAVS